MKLQVLIPSDISEAGKQYLRDRGYEIKMGAGWTRTPSSPMHRAAMRCWCWNRPITLPDPRRTSLP